MPNLGVARGVIEIGLEKLKSDSAVAISAFRQMGDGAKSGFGQATEASSKFGTSVESLSQRITNAQSRIDTFRQRADQIKQTFDTSATAASSLAQETVGLGEATNTLGSRFEAMKKRIDETKVKLTALEQAENETGRTTSKLDATFQAFGQRVKSAFAGAEAANKSFKESLIGTVKVADNLADRLKAIQGELIAVSVAGTLLTKTGLSIADSMTVLNARFEAITGSQQKAVQLMSALETQARRFGLPVLETQQSFSRMAGQIQAAGENVEDFIPILARLRLADPTATAIDAQIALREALTGNFLSASRRFELGTQAEFKRLLEETGSVAAAFDIMLNKVGATEDLALELADSFKNASDVFQDAGSRALGRGFTPYVDLASKAMLGLADVLDRTPDSLLQIGAGAIIAVTGFASMTLAVSQLLSSYQNLQKAGFFTQFGNVGRNIGKAGVLAGAAAVGTGAGIGIVRGIGRATGDERLQNFNLNDAANTLKQGLFLIIHALIEGGRNIALAIGRAVAIFQAVGDVVDRWKDRLSTAFSIVIEAFGNAFSGIIEGIADAIQWVQDHLPGGTRGVRRADEVRTQAEEVRQQTAPSESRSFIPQIDPELEAAINQQFDEFQLGVARAFGAIPTEAEEAAEIIKDSVKDGMGIIEQQNEAYLAGLQSRISFEQQYIELLREGTPEQVQDRIQALKDERAAIEQFLPQLEAIAATSGEAAEELANYRDRLTEIDSQSTQLGTALLAATERAMDAINSDIGKLDSEFAQEVAKIEGERQKALNEAFDDLKQNLTELDADVLKKSRELGAENIEALEEFQDREREIIAEHRERVLQIERKSREDILDAASRLDAAGVASARRQREEQLTEANKQLNEERDKNQEKLSETQKNLAEEAAELQAYYLERRNQLIAENQADIVQLNEKFNAELQTAETAYQQERAKLQQHLAQLVGMRISASAQEANAVRQGLQATQQAFSGFFSSLAQQASQLSSAIQKAAVVTKAPTTINSISSSGSFGGSTVQRAVRQQVRFNTGGVASFAGSGSALAFVENKERILTPSQNALFERLITSLPNLASTGATQSLPNLDNIGVDVTGLESFEAILAQAVRNTIGAILAQRLAGG